MATHSIVDYTTKIKSFFSNKQELAEAYAIVGRLGAKQLIPLPYFTTNGGTISGVTFNYDEDGAITAEGTSTGYADFSLFRGDSIWPDGDYTLSVQNNLPTGYVLRVRGSATNSGTLYNIARLDSTAKSVNFTLTTQNNRWIRIDLTLLPSAEATNDAVYPMLRFANDTDKTFEPYSKSNKVLTAEVNKLIGDLTKIEGNNLTQLYANRLVMRFSSLSQLAERVALGIKTETMLYVESLGNYYALKRISTGDTENDCIFIDSSYKIIPQPSPLNNSITIRALGGNKNSSTTENMAKIANAIKYAMNNNLVLIVPQGKYYVNESIEITNDLIIRGETTFGKSGRVSNVTCSAIQFTPGAANQSLFVDNGEHQVSIKHVNFLCDYTYCTQTFEEQQSSPYAYYTWTYTYDNVNCLNLPLSKMYISDVGIYGFSGYGLTCRQNAIVDNVRIAVGKYGFYNCKTDVLYQSCYVTECEYAFYFDAGSVLFAYDTWIDRCGYGVYSNHTLNGIFTGLIDHCLYAGICAQRVETGLTIDARVGRCGMYYAGTDMVAHAPSTDSNESFLDMSKGVFFAIRNGSNIRIKTSSKPRTIPDSAEGSYYLPSLLVFGNRLINTIIESAYKFEKATYIAIDPLSSVYVSDINDLRLNQRNKTLYADNGFLIPFPYYDDPKATGNLTFSVNDDMSLTINGSTGNYGIFTLFRGVTDWQLGDTFTLTNLGDTLPADTELQVGYWENDTFTKVDQCNTSTPSTTFVVTSDMVGKEIMIRYLIFPNVVINDLTVRPLLGYPGILTNRELTVKKLGTTDLKAVVAASSDFADFQSRIAAL